MCYNTHTVHYLQGVIVMQTPQPKPKNLPDRRILRTKKAIRDAFLTMLADMPFEDITVSALSEYAGINRKTFYLYCERFDFFQ